MKALLFILLATTLSCGTHEKKKDCRIESDSPEFTVIACGKQKTIITKGQDGENGSQGNTGASGTNGTDGIDGEDGFSTVFAVVSATTCPAGGSHILMATDSNRSGALEPSDADLSSATICNGENGQAGTDGSDGQDGVDGIDGTDGTNGTDAPPSAFSVVNVIDPCGDTPGIIDEVLLQLGNGTLLASVSDKVNGENTRLSVLLPGTYKTTDDSKCNFTVTSANQLTNEHY